MKIGALDGQAFMEVRCFKCNLWGTCQGAEMAACIKTDSKLRTYIGFMREAGQGDGACLIFAHNTREAKKLNWPVIRDWWTDAEWIDNAVRRLRENQDWLFSCSDVGKLIRGEAHVNDNPPSCSSCEQWGQPINEDGYCPDCAESDVLNAKSDRNTVARS
jgi:hypothetical protein